MLAIGIDLGTTNSAIAQLDHHGKPIVIPNELGESITPSVICFEPGQTSFGAPAKELQSLGSYPVAVFFKRQMGDEYFLFHVDGVDYTAVDLSAMLLKKLVEDAQSRLGQNINDVVITVPAYFKDPERQATIAAGKAAGLNVLQVINEPTAAAVAYGLDKAKDKQTVLVYDLGGGTFDVTLLSLDNGQVRVINSDGDHQLGGKDWDDRIIDYLANQFEQEFGSDPLEDAESMADLLIQAEDAKKKLTKFEKTTVSITHEGDKGRYTLERSTFESITSDLMERTMSLTTRVMEDISVKPEQLDGVLLVGGSTRMPMVHEFIERDLKVKLLHGVNVDEAVALGAAMVAAERLTEQSASAFSLGGRTKTIDVTNHSLGMIAVNTNQTAYLNSIILPKNATIPCQQERPFQHRTRRNGTNELEIYMTQGESEGPGDVAYLGRYLVTDIPHQQGKPAVIDIEYQYDQSGTVNVAATERNSRKTLPITVEPLPSDIPQRFLLPPEIEQAAEPVTAYLAFDLSGSMSGSPLRAAQDAALGFLQNTDLGHCAIGIIAFSDRTKTTLKATQNAKKIEAAIRALSVGETGYGNDTDPFDELHKLLKKVDGQRFGIVLADGAWFHQDVAVQKAKRCHKEEIEVIAIGFGGADKQFLNEIASTDEGSFFTSQEGLVETFSTIAQVLTESGGTVSQQGPNQASGNGKKRGLGLFSKMLNN